MLWFVLTALCFIGLAFLAGLEVGLQRQRGNYFRGYRAGVADVLDQQAEEQA